MTSVLHRQGNRRLGKDVWGSGRSMWDVDKNAAVEIDNLVVREESASATVARLLDVDEGTAVVTRDRRYLVGGRPVQHAIAHVPAAIAAGTAIAEPDTGPGGVYARLADLGHEPVRFSEDLHARMPRPHESLLLDLAPGTPVIEITRVAHTGDGRAVEVSRMTLDATAYVLSYDFDA